MPQTPATNKKERTKSFFFSPVQNEKEALREKKQNIDKVSKESTRSFMLSPYTTPKTQRVLIENKQTAEQESDQEADIGVFYFQPHLTFFFYFLFQASARFIWDIEPARNHGMHLPLMDCLQAYTFLGEENFRTHKAHAQIL